MKRYIEIKENSYEDTIEHLYKIKNIACKLIKMMAEYSNEYEDENTDYNTSDYESREKGIRKSKGRYEY